MELHDFIADTERRHFRTNMDTGANMNALIVWNMVRKFAGLQRLEHDDLSQKHADGRGISLEEQKADEAKMDEYSTWQSDVNVLSKYRVPKQYWPENPFKND